MPQPEHFDVLVLGSGQGGQLIARHLAQAGQRAALVERRWVGGSCPNIACMPSKTELWSARVAHLARNGESLGITTGDVTIDMPTVLRHKRDMVAGVLACKKKAQSAETLHLTRCCRGGVGQVPRRKRVGATSKAQKKL